MSATPRAQAASGDHGDPVRDSALGLVPDILDRYIPLSRKVWQEGPLNPAQLEMVRLRNARKVNCVFCRNARYDIAKEAGLSEAMIQQIDDNYQHSDLSRREKLLLAFTDQYLDAPTAMSDSLKAELVAEFSTEELVHLSLALLLFNTFSRCAVALGGMPDELPLMEVSLPK